MKKYILGFISGVITVAVIETIEEVKKHPNGIIAQQLHDVKVTWKTILKDESELNTEEKLAWIRLNERLYH